MKKRVEIFLEEEEIELIEKYAEVLTSTKAEEEKDLPPSKRGGSVSRSKAARELILIGLEWCGVTLK